MSHKNKTLATALALTLGGLGAHRFYLHGNVDRIGLLYACSLPVAGLVYSQTEGSMDVFFALLPLLLSYIVAFIAALVIGLTPDEQWDDILLVSYPSKEAFLAMIGDSDYQAAAEHRSAALADSRLIGTTPY